MEVITAVAIKRAMAVKRMTAEKKTRWWKKIPDMHRMMKSCSIKEHQGRIEEV